MHYSNLVIVRKEEPFDLEAAVEKAMGPDEENGGFWDWYQIGDVIPVAELTEAHLEKFYRIVLPDGFGIYGGERYIPWAEGIQEKFVKTERPPLAWIKKTFVEEADGEEFVAVAVDNHN